VAGLEREKKVRREGKLQCFLGLPLKIWDLTSIIFISIQFY